MSPAARALRSPIGWALLIILLVLAGASTLTIVPETEQALVVRMGVPTGVMNRYQPGAPIGAPGAGLLAHVPFLDSVYLIDKRPHSLSLPDEPLTSADGQDVAVAGYARYRIVDPVRMFLTAQGDRQRVDEALKPAFASALRAAMVRLSLAQMLAPEKSAAPAAIAAALDRTAREYGARIVDVRISHVGLPDGAPLDAAVSRMRTEQQQKAAAIRDDGYRQAMAIRAQGDADAAKLYADAFNQDPKFYDFYRAMQSYRATFGVDRDAPGSTQMVIAPDSEYFRQFRDGGK